MKDKCRNGHPRTEGLWVWNKDGTRKCVLCARATGNKRRARMRAERVMKQKPTEQVRATR